ncbi:PLASMODESMATA CALLOSE-BINDING PROTEIN 2 [Zea mays]|nr:PLASMODESMATA CALLOSE-BINDING PROTEIN 2 [Zea mays]
MLRDTPPTELGAVQAAAFKSSSSSLEFKASREARLRERERELYKARRRPHCRGTLSLFTAVACRLTSTASMADTARLFMLVAVATAALAGRSDGAWCVCRSDLADSALQKTLDYACGGGADCKPILQSGACFAPDTVKAHCSYAANSFYQRNGQNPQACVFSGTAALSNVDPSANGCTYPATPSAAATTSSSSGSAGVYSPPAMGPSALNDNSAAAGVVLPMAGAGRLLILACCSLVALYYLGA